MNLVKAKIIGGDSEGCVLWVDKDSLLTHWNNGDITTYKTYDFYNGKKSKDDISGHDYHARIKKEYIEFIEEESKTTSLFETIVTTYGDQPIFSVITACGTMVDGDMTFKQCKELIKCHEDYDTDDFEIVMKIMETSTVKQMKPTI
jgi:hypothetical protein